MESRLTNFLWQLPQPDKVAIAHVFQDASMRELNWNWRLRDGSWLRTRPINQQAVVKRLVTAMNELQLEQVPYTSKVMVEVELLTAEDRRRERGEIDQQPFTKRGIFHS